MWSAPAGSAVVDATPVARAASAVLDAGRVARWGHVARLAVASAVLVAVGWSGDGATRGDLRIAVLAFVATVAATGFAVWRTELRPRALGPSVRAGVGARWLAGALAALDLALVTAAVHVTGGGASQFAALYILAIAGAALALPFAGAGAAAAFGCALYALDVLWWRPGPEAAPLALGLQLVVFGLVALAAGWLGARLRAAGAGGEELAQALARARVEAADILRNIRSGVVTVDAAGRLLYANAAADALLGTPVRARLGRPVLDLVAGAAPGLADALAAAAGAGERTTRAEVPVARSGDGADGGATLGVTTTVGEGVGGARTGTAIFSDITASKRLEALHLRAERLEAVAGLAASLAHEIRNPLASIRSAVEQLARLTAVAERAPLGRDGADDARALAGLTMRESDRLSRLLGEFLDFARARVTRRERLDVGEAAREAARLAAAHPDAAGVAVLVDVPVDEGALVVDGDAELLHRALFNLVLNGAQAAAANGGGGVRVVVRGGEGELPAGLAFAHGGVVVHVADDGAGVAPELVGRLFDPFFTTRAGGSGLGLAVVQRAVEAHGGVVLVEAGGGGVGARFSCVLPRVERTGSGEREGTNRVGRVGEGR